jgi:phosphorylcholine metabolism protein LicD
MNGVTTIGIQSFHDALATVGVRVWLQGGALLGLVRNGKPIGWDTDVDFGVFDDDWNSIGVRALEDAGFRFTQYHVDNFGHYQSVCATA